MSGAPLTGKVELFDRDITVMLNDALGPAAQSAALADYARGVEKEAEATDQSALGYVPPHTTIVDGSEGDEAGVKPNGTIVYEFQLIGELFTYIDELLIQHSPVKSGRYVKSHVFYADGTPFDPAGEAPQASEYVIANTQPYARKIEKGESPQFPDGVYEAVATLANGRFGNLAKISFGYRPIQGGAIGDYAATASAAAHAARHSRRGNNASQWLTNQPAIIVTVR